MATHYHPQSNGIMERNNRGLGDSLRAFLLDGKQEEWHMFLPQLMRTFWGTSHTATGETANYMIYGRELRLPDQLVDDMTLPVMTETIWHEYVVALQERLKVTHDPLRDKQHLLRDKQQEVCSWDKEQPPAVPGWWLRLVINRRWRGEKPKL